MKIFHLVEKEKWIKTNKNEDYRPKTLEGDGFIHCCKADQLEMVLKLFHDKGDLIILRIDCDLISHPVKFEYPREASLSALEFPHIYGALNRDAIDKEFTIKFNSGYSVPEDLLS